ncbi:hypothetical protein GCM10009837_10190 [Streptomyces durmitorensis]|uniref:ImmA/IrrE family metallo-endopeptidase n=1 Tax=Streptomyces durmitorensis TaxID=319947 RepID=A0ABY4PM44_9ACTN|nr:ImmA/IrrE family metallo-endopeptidase [Streptomyces durmitorensis]UQT54123.1 ImmA/IrrE family metallo-endopeptidase [Streptomyces durmitorensis]
MHSIGTPEPEHRTGPGRLIPGRVSTALRKRRAWSMEERRAARLIYKELQLAPDAGLMDLVEAVGKKRGRPIEIVQRSLSPQATGMCLPGKDGDRIVITTNTSPHHQRFILGHELFHLLEGEEDDCVSGHHFQGSVALESELSTLPPGLVDEVLSGPVFFRTTFERRAEWRAEAFGTVAALQLTGKKGAGSLTSAFANRRFH